MVGEFPPDLVVLLQEHYKVIQPEELVNLSKQQEEYTSLVVIQEDEPFLKGLLLAKNAGLIECGIIVMGSGSELELENALARGADFYLRSPGWRELVARIHAVLRRGSFSAEVL